MSKYEYHISVLMYDLESGRSEPCARCTLTGEFPKPEDPRGLLTLEAMKHALGTLLLAQKYTAW